MKFEVIETGEAWVVSREGVELARHDQQNQALDDVASRLRNVDPGDSSVSLRVRFAARG